VIGRAHARGVPAALVQDGVLARTPPRHGARAAVGRFARAGGSRALGLVGLGYLGSSAYGQGGADIVCVTGPASLRLLRDRGVPTEQLRTTGQPRFDVLASVAGPAPGGPVTWFTTPFESEGLGGDAAAAQHALAAAVGRACAAAGGRLVVRPHPREDAATYAAAGIETWPAASEQAAVLAASSVAIAGISTALDEAVIAGIPVAVPGEAVHGRRWSSMLPPADVFPRFVTAEDAVAILARLGDAGAAARIGEQRAWLADRVTFGPGHEAASAVANALLELVR
jgi:hypothetical protein